MTAWHFTVALLPQQWLDGGGSVDDLCTAHGYSTAAAWVAGDPGSIQRRMESILPLSESWGGSLLRWGAAETDDIMLIFTNDRVRSLNVRFDMRHPNMALFDQVISAAEDLRLALLDVPHRRIVPRNVAALVEAAAASRAARFAKRLSQEGDA